MPTVHVFFDIDGTLIECTEGYSEEQKLLCANQAHLTPVQDEICIKGHPLSFSYLIHHYKTAELMKKLLTTPNVLVHFITSANYPRSILDVFASQYNLPINSFAAAAFINRHSYPALNQTLTFEGKTHCTMLKGVVLNYLMYQDDEFIELDDVILLVDDQDVQLQSAREAQFAAIKSAGLVLYNLYSQDTDLFNDRYLQAISDYVDTALNTFKEVVTIEAVSILKHAPRF